MLHCGFRRANSSFHRGDRFRHRAVFEIYSFAMYGTDSVYYNIILYYMIDFIIIIVKLHKNATKLYDLTTTRKLLERFDFSMKHASDIQCVDMNSTVCGST